MRSGRRDHESFIGSYGAEREMPDRGPRRPRRVDVERDRDRQRGGDRWSRGRDRWRDEWDDGTVNPYDRDRRGRGGRY